MKNYFNFTLTGKKLLPIWLLFIVLFIAPYIAIIYKMKQLTALGEKPSMLIFPLIILLIIIAFGLMFYITKLMIESVVYKDKSVTFNGNFGKFFGMTILGFFLTIITLGIYSAWFIRNIQRFFVDNSSYNSHNFSFMGKGGKLFVILLFTIIIPVIASAILLAKFLAIDMTEISMARILYQVIFYFVLIPYMYLLYKWMVDFRIKEYQISWQTEFWPSCGKIAIEMLLTFVTIGIYLPMAILRLYAYFAEKTIIQGSETQQRFGFELDPLKDFLFIWGQLLLTIITLGIYYPWSCCKIGKRLLSKTYLEKK